MNLKLIISDFLHTPPNVIPKKLLSQLSYRKEVNALFKHDQVNQSYQDITPGNPSSLVSVDPLKLSRDELKNSILPTEFYAEHRFDILGSGWIDWNYQSRQKENITVDSQGEWLKSLVNESNLIYSNKIWSEILKIYPEYRPIDWQWEGKAGVRYDGKRHFSKLKSTIISEGIDVKVVWELGRLQHLPVMLSAILAKDNDAKLVNEVKCQLLDFIMSNPPRWGVQWTSAMDAAMRLFSMSLSLDLLLQIDTNLKSSPFYSVVASSINDHIQFAWKFREHKNGLSNNHYLANLVGVLYGCYFLQEKASCAEILKEAIPVLLKEIDKQFLMDGGNFESSIPYHFFGMEISVLGLSMIKRVIQDNKIESGAWKRIITGVETKIRNGLELMDWSEISKGIIPQIGDNDSSRMIFLNYPYSINNQSNIDRDYLNYTSTFDVVNAFFKPDISSLHANLIYSIVRKEMGSVDISDSDNLNFVKSESLKYLETTSYEVKDKSTDLHEELKFKAFPQFGIYFFKGKNIYLCVNGSNRHVKQYWPHAHNDKLSFELWIEGSPVVQDPGSYLYTSNPKMRNEYRSIKAHATAVFGNQEQNDWEEGLAGVFRTIPRTDVSVVEVSSNSIVLKLTYKDIIHMREFKIEKNKLTINDFGNKEFMVNKYPEIAFSNGYGKALTTQ